MNRDLKSYKQHVCLALTTILFACGTRVGNPKKPDDNSKFIKLPTIGANIPENDLDETATSGLKLTTTKADAGTDAISSGVPSGNVTVESFNQLVEKLNQGEIKIDETILVSTEDGDIKGQIRNSKGTAYNYNATFCANNKPFIFIQWTEDQNSVEAVRHIDNTPYADNRLKHNNDGTEVKQDIVWKKNDPVQLVIYQTRVPPKRASILKMPTRTIDTFKFRISAEGVADFTGVSDLRFEGTTDDGGSGETGDFVADVRVAGQVRPDKNHFYLAHKTGMPLLCKSDFDEDNQTAPGWCFGLKRRGITTYDYSVLTKNEIDTAWSLINDMPIAMEAELKEVDFPTEAVCPQ